MNDNRARICLSILLVSTVAAPFAGNAAEKEFGIEGESAPSWEAVEWANLPEGKTTLDVSDYRGKILYITFFQTMCGGCHQHGLPALKAAIDSQQENIEVAFVAIQTAFERFDKNDMEGAKKTAGEFGLEIPIGHQGEPGTPAPILWTYDAGGTPWTIIVDREGIVRFNGNLITGKRATEIIGELLSADEPAN